MVASVLESTGLMVLAQVYIYKMVFCSVLLYGIKSWMVTGGDAQGPDGVPPLGGVTDHGG